MYTGFWWGNLRANDHLEDPGVNWKMILRWIFRKWNKYCSGLGWVAGTYECGNEPSGSTKCGEFFDSLRTV
jgi:hypothetical protein